MHHINKNSMSRVTTTESTPIYISCVFHPTQQITNFCAKGQCLLPMCPTCVAIHSQQHMQENTHGDFFNIQEVIQNISKLLVKTNQTLEELSQEYTEDYWNKQKITQSCKQKLNDFRKKLIKEIDRKFQEIEHKMTRKINQFEDKIHDRYKQLQGEIQYLYDSMKFQMDDFSASNQKLLKNVINFHKQKKQDKIQKWIGKFKSTVTELKIQSFKVNVNQELLTSLSRIQSYFSFQQFKDEQNQYLISTARNLINSETKRKIGSTLQSPIRQQSSENKENSIPVRTNQNLNNIPRYQLKANQKVVLKPNNNYQDTFY